MLLSETELIIICFQGHAPIHPICLFSGHFGSPQLPLQLPLRLCSFLPLFFYHGALVDLYRTTSTKLLFFQAQIAPPRPVPSLGRSNHELVPRLYCTIISGRKRSRQFGRCSFRSRAAKATRLTCRAAARSRNSQELTSCHLYYTASTEQPSPHSKKRKEKHRGDFLSQSSVTSYVTGVLFHRRGLVFGTGRQRNSEAFTCPTEGLISSTLYGSTVTRM